MQKTAYPAIKLITKAEFQKPKYPLILCHGLFGFNYLGPSRIKFLQMRYWDEIEDELKNSGCSVFCAKVSPLSSIQVRAQELHKYLSDNFSGQSINVVGHSMGGLDARFLLSHIKDRNYTIKSLTTIATPHRGSSFMDWCRDKIGVGHLSIFASRYFDDLVISNFDSLYHESLIYESNDKKLARFLGLIDAPAFTNLTREYCNAFNELTKDVEGVYYASYAAYSPLKAPGLLTFAQSIIAEREGLNDGMVSVESAKWGDFQGVVDGSHWDLVPPKLRFKSLDRYNRKEFYFTIVTRLAQLGF